MPSLRYLHLDVFTGTPLEGNQLAVFPEPGSIDAAMMQAITREMDFSECTFVFPPERGGDIRMRIFTPGEELPMAGHPTIGTTFALAAEGVIARRRTEFVFELGVGPTPVSLEWNGDTLSFAWMTQRLPEFGGTITDRPSLSAAIGPSCGGTFRIFPRRWCRVACPFLFVPLASRAAVDAVTIDRKALSRCSRDAGVEELPTSSSPPRARRRRRRRKRSTAACSLLPSAFSRIRRRRRQRTARAAISSITRSSRRRPPQHPQPAGGTDEAPEPHSHFHRQRRWVDHRVRVGGRSVMVGARRAPVRLNADRPA